MFASSVFKACCILEGWDCCRKTSAPSEERKRIPASTLGFLDRFLWFLFLHFRSFGPITWKKKIRISYQIISYHIIIISYIIYHFIISASCLILSVITRSHFSPASSFASPWELSAEQPQTLPGRRGRSSARNSCHSYSTRQKKNRGSVCFFSKFGRIQRSKICKIMKNLSH